MTDDEKKHEHSSISISKAIFEVQSFLIDLPQCTDSQLLAAAALISRPDYEDVVTERSITHLCGYPCCPNSLLNRPRKGRYRISLVEHRVYDLEDTYNFCSEACLISSRAFSGTLPEERLTDLSSTRTSKVLGAFEGSMVLVEDGASGEDGDLGLSNLTIWEKSGMNAGEVPLEEWIGPANAIEGYIPQRERLQGVEPKSKHKSKTQKRDSMDTASDAKFKSDIFVEEFKSDVFVGKPFQITGKQHSSSVSLSDATNTMRMYGNTTEGNMETEFTNAIVTGKSSSTGQTSEMPSYYGKSDLSLIAKSSPDENGSKTKEELSQQKLKSSLKSAGSISRNHSVKWADRPHVSDSFTKEILHGYAGSSCMTNKLDDDTSLRLAFAEVCATALAQASEAVLSGELEADDAVSEAGLVVLPHSQDDQDTDFENVEDAFMDRASAKWPKKPVFLDTGVFDVQDSWHDTPPEGFSLKLSSFATMWMALFEWITCSSLVYIYGHNENSEEEFLSVNGREYPRKIVLSDGRSLEIKQTIAACIARMLPQIVADLRLRIPLSTIEKGMVLLLDTMSFVEAIPPFKTKEWIIIVLLFIEALSVFRVPMLSKQMVNKKVILSKYLDAAQLSAEEYETLKDLIMPLGRCPQFSVHGG